MNHERGTALSVQKFLYSREGGISISLCCHQSNLEILSIRLIKVLIMVDQVAQLKAVVYRFKQHGSSFSKLVKASGLVHKLLGDCNKSNTPPFRINVPLCVKGRMRTINSRAKFLDALKRHSSTRNRLHLRFGVSQLNCFAMLPPRNSDRNQNCHDAAYSLDQCGCVLPEADVAAKPKQNQCRGKSEGCEQHVYQHVYPFDFLPHRHSIDFLFVVGILPPGGWG